MFLPSSCSDRNVTYTTESYLFRAKETNCMWRHFQTFDVAGWRGSGYITTSGVKAKERIWEVLENYLETISFRKNTFGKNYFKKNQGKWKVCMGVHPIDITNLLGYPKDPTRGLRFLNMVDAYLCLNPYKDFQNNQTDWWKNTISVQCYRRLCNHENTRQFFNTFLGKDCQ